MNYTFNFETHPGYLHFAGVSSDSVEYVSEHELMSMTHEQLHEFRLLMGHLARQPGVHTEYEPEHRRWRICFGIPRITILDTHRLEYPNE